VRLLRGAHVIRVVVVRHCSAGCVCSPAVQLAVSLVGVLGVKESPGATGLEGVGGLHVVVGVRGEQGWCVSWVAV